MNMKQHISFKELQPKSILVLIGYTICFCIGLTLSIFPFISELSFRKAHVLSNEASLHNFKYINRYNFSFSEFEKATWFFPWETHYPMAYIKELEKYGRHIKDKNKKLEAFQKAYALVNRIQTIDPINPWYHSKKSLISYELYALTKDKTYLDESIYRNKLSALIDYENPIFLLNYANMLHKNRRYSEAFYYYKRALAIDIRFPEAHYNIAHLYTIFNKSDIALFHYLETKRLKPNFSNIDSIILRHYLSTKNYKDGNQYIESHNLGSVPNKKILETVCYFYYLQNKNHEALAVYNNYFKLPKRVLGEPIDEIYLIYIQCLIKTNQLQLAKKTVEGLLQKQPQNRSFLSMYYAIKQRL